MDVDLLKREEFKGALNGKISGPRARICRRLEFPVFESPKFGNIRKVILQVNMAKVEERSYQIMVFSFEKNRGLNICTVY
jgi:hypothetical protein